MFSTLMAVLNNIKLLVLGMIFMVLSFYLIYGTLGQQIMGGTICGEYLAPSGSNWSCPVAELVKGTSYAEQDYYCAPPPAPAPRLPFSPFLG